MPRKKQPRIFVYSCDYCGTKHENINCGSDYIIYASGHRFCRKPDCWSLYIKQEKKKEEERNVRNEEKRKRVYEKRIFNEKEKEERQKVISKLDQYLNYLKGNHAKEKR
jgi:hypothetical protein